LYRESENGNEHSLTFKAVVSIDAPLVIAIHIDGTRDRDFRILKIVVTTVPSLQEMSTVGSKSVSIGNWDVSESHVGWLMLRPSTESLKHAIASSSSPSLSFRLGFTPRGNSRPIRIRQLCVLNGWESLANGSEHTTGRASRPDPHRIRHDLALQLFHDLSLQVFQGKAQAPVSQVEADQGSSGDLKQQVVGLLLNQKTQLNRVQSFVCEHLLSELTKEATRIFSGRDGSGDHYAFELLTMLSSLIASEAGAKFIGSHLNVSNVLMRLLFCGTDRCHALIVSIFVSLSKFGAKLNSQTSSFLYGPSDIHDFIPQLLTVLAQCIELQVRFKGAGRRAENTDFSMTKCIESAFPNSISATNSVALRAFVAQLEQSSEWRGLFEVGSWLRYDLRCNVFTSF
jgi:hypothetical protein